MTIQAVKEAILLGRIDQEIESGESRPLDRNH